MSLPRSFEAQLSFLIMAMMSNDVGRKSLSTVRKAINSRPAGMVVKLLQKVWDAITRFYVIEPLWVVKQPYLWFNPAVIQR